MTRTRTRKIGILMTVLGMGVFASSANATVQNFFAFDPDGTLTGSGPIANVGSFDWAVDNALSVGGSSAVANFVSGEGPTTFNTFYQARLTGILTTSNANLIPASMIPGSGGQTGEITIIAGFQEMVTGFSGVLGVGTATFKSTGATGGGIPNFFAIYFDNGPVSAANPLTGLGYDNGTLIMDGTILPDAIASTTFPSLGPLVAPFPVLDSFGSDNYSGTAQYGGGPADSIRGVGQSQLNATPGIVNIDFFKNIPVLTSLVNTTNTLNFTQVDPASHFYFTEGGAATLAGAGIGIASLGIVNGSGAVAPGGGPDIQFQSDGSQSFTVEAGIPEPVTATLGMLGLGALSLVISRRRTA